MKKIDFTEAQIDIIASGPREEGGKVDKVIQWMAKAEEPLFQGKDEVPPIKIYQVGRIFKLAKLLLELIIIIWPYLKQIIKLFKK